jgi:hypothetical protein
VLHFKVFGTALVGLTLLASAGMAQEPGQFYKKPETTAELWRAVNHEIELGQYKLAAAYLHGFLAKNPSDDELLQIQENEGSSAFTRLLNIPELRSEAKGLVERVDALVQKHLSDRKWLDRLIQNLHGSAEERAYAIEQLRRSGALAMPALIDALAKTSTDPTQHTAILTALERLDARIVPPLTAALATSDAVIRGELIDVIRRRGDTQAVPFLWYYSAAPSQPDVVRAKARDTLAAFLDRPADQLDPARVALARLAEDYYQHRVPLAAAAPTAAWRWEGKGLTAQNLSASQAEEFYGLLFARQAVELDPAYRRAQVIFLSLAVEKAFERAGPGQSLFQAAPAVAALVNGAGTDLLIAVLEKALQDRRLGVILGSVRALGAQSAVPAARGDGRSAPALARAVTYPDRRVQIAAADAILGMPALVQPVASAHVVEILRRTALGDTVAHVLIADPDRFRAESVAAAASQVGFEPIVVQTGREALRRLAQAADIDIVLVSAAIPDPQLPYLLAQLNASVNDELVPIVVMASRERVDGLQKLFARRKNLTVLQETTAAATLQRVFAAALSAGVVQPLTNAERKDETARAMEWLARIARHEIQGYDARPASDAVIKGLHSADLVNFAVEAAGSLPGDGMQRDLAALVLDQNQQEPVRSKAARELCRNIQAFGPSLGSTQLKNLETLEATATDAKLRASVALVLGSMRPSSTLNGERLLRFQPALTTAAPVQKPK